ncbi:MAG: RNase adapter RapZ [Clostridia bacterium]|nr:RNase adapter RapZ [Clostridia bacterium]
MRFLILTGMSGAGKTQALHFLEDMGYYCIDNMPPIFLAPFAQACYGSGIGVENVAVVMDIRSGEMFDKVGAELEKLRDEELPYEVVFFEASDSVLVKRYKETRRVHPLSVGGKIADGIAKEREKLALLRQMADYVIDTSNILTRELQEIIKRKFGDGGGDDSYFVLNLQSFGFKYGIPDDSDLVFDVRFLPNPYYIETLKYKTGLDEDVYNFVMNSHNSATFLDMVCEMVVSLVPWYIEEGKHQLVMSVGCTGGHHRSVSIAEAVRKRIMNQGINISITHRDIGKN